MAEPSLSSSSPAAGSTGNYINVNPVLTFAGPLDATTVNVNTFHLVDSVTGDRVALDTSYDSTNYKVTLLLKQTLRENTVYRIIVIGSDLKVTEALKSSDSTELSTSIIVEFTTGDSAYDVDTVIEKDAQEKTLEGDLVLPSNIKVLGYDLVITKEDPKNYSHNVSVSLNGSKEIHFTFSKDMTTNDPSSWAKVAVYPLLTDDYIVESDTFQKDASASYTMPTPSISVVGKDVIIVFDKDIPKNMGIDVELTKDIVAADGSDFGGSFYSISVETYPKTMTPRTIQRELRHIAGEDIRETYIGALLLKNSIFLYERLGGTLDLSDLSFAAKKYIMYATILDIIEDKEYEKFLLAGTRRQFADGNISTDSLIGRLAMKVASARREKEVAFETLMKGWQFKGSEYKSSAPSNSRLWFDINGRYTDPVYKYYQPDLPFSNVALSRHAKLNNPEVI
ncbi:MAG: hypothetical protein D6732_14120 [Methanobacteriota archaeon]|nr:MAG: hypothetical protein D6732_14120 [Euryarchaeota archaeon]